MTLEVNDFMVLVTAVEEILQGLGHGGFWVVCFCFVFFPKAVYLSKLNCKNPEIATESLGKVKTCSEEVFSAVFLNKCRLGHVPFLAAMGRSMP